MNKEIGVNSERIWRPLYSEDYSRDGGGWRWGVLFCTIYRRLRLDSGLQPLIK